MSAKRRGVLSGLLEPVQVRLRTRKQVGQTVPFQAAQFTVPIATFHSEAYLREFSTLPEYSPYVQQGRQVMFKDPE